MRIGRGFALGVAMLLGASASPGWAQINLIRNPGLELDLTGYVRTLTGVHDAGYETGLGSSTTGFHGAVTRLKWTATVPGRVSFTVHNRLLASLTSSGTSPVAGFGVSRTPGRAVDLSSTWVEEERLGVVHDFDRLALTVYTSIADVTIGRQAVSWGTSSLFPVADVWAAFSPFELDTEEKPGIDAVRVLAYPFEGGELDAVVADRGDDGVSAGARIAASLTQWELWAGGGKVWNEAMAMAGLNWIGDVVTLRTEAVLPRDTEADKTLDPRITLGLDYIGPKLAVTAEYRPQRAGRGRQSGLRRAPRVTGVRTRRDVLPGPPLPGRGRVHQSGRSEPAQLHRQRPRQPEGRQPERHTRGHVRLRPERAGERRPPDLVR